MGNIWEVYMVYIYIYLYWLPHFGALVEAENAEYFIPNAQVSKSSSCFAGGAPGGDGTVRSFNASFDEYLVENECFFAEQLSPEAGSGQSDVRLNSKH